ncbi:MAG: hypothetical protein PHP54_00090 [Clostridia bacterium]|nr:hypothetical protein [Clostridia bacterium]
MDFNKNDEVEIQSNEYIVINKSTNDGREYLFVADKLHPNINLIDNFNEDALKLLLFK